MIERLMIPVPEAGINLEATLGKGQLGAAVIAPPHPLHGGSLDNPVVEALAEGFTRAEVAPLCFNFRGTGESSGEASGAARDADTDYRAAFARLVDRHPGPYYAGGYSFGAASAIRVAGGDPRIARLFLVAPPLAMIDRKALANVRGSVSLIIGDNDEYTPRAELERALEPFPNLRLHLLPGVDHFFSSGGLDELTQLIAQSCCST